jgi:hypothetical protein
MMSDHDEPPAFSGSGDPREEALWEAYQAILRRRDATGGRRFEPAAEPIGRPAEPAARSPRAAPRARPTRRLRPPRTTDPVVRALPTRDRRLSQARAATGGACLILAAGAALAIGLWPRAHVIHAGAQPAHRLRVIAETRPADLLKSRPTLPCFVGGRPIGRFTLDDCASRNGVASGPLEVGLSARAYPPATPAPAAAPSVVARAAAPTVAPVVAQAPAPITSPSALPAEPPALRPPSRTAPPRRIVSPPVRFFADASAASRPLPASARLTAPRRAFAEPPPAETPPAPTPAQQVSLVEPTVRAAPAPEPERTPVAHVSLRSASARAVREFYRALGEGDGARAAAVVIPEERAEGPLSADELTRFYSALRGPLRLTRVDPINDDTVFVGYQFVSADNRLCTGTARVNTIQRDGETLVRRIRAFNGC